MITYTQCIRVFIAVAALVTCSSASAQFYGGYKEQKTMLTIKADGTSTVRVEGTQNRALLERQLRMWEQYRQRAEAGDDDKPAPPKKAEGDNENKAFTDAELEQKLRDLQKFTAEQTGEQDETKFEQLEISKDSVRSVTSRSYASLEDLLSQAYAVWGQSGLFFDNLRLEKDTENHLRLTFTSPEQAGRYFKTVRQQWKITSFKSEMKIVLPGKILSSGFSNTVDNSTWIEIDGTKTESVDAVMKLFEAPVVITAELAGLKVDEPLESEKLQMRSNMNTRSPGSDLPITDAGPGFAAEAVGVTTTTIHYFPGGEKALKQNPMYGRDSNAGTVVHARLFAPKGRVIKTLSEIKIIKATDDQARPLGVAKNQNSVSETSFYSSNDDDEQRANSTQFNLELQLPPPDAKSIEEISAEAVAVTIGKWKEMVLTNLQANAEKPIDLSSVLPGAKLTISKVDIKQNNVTIKASLTGPEAISGVEFKAKIPGNEEFNSYSMNENSRVSGKEHTRKLNIQGNSFSENKGPLGSVTLQIRYPDDLRRERVKFKLNGLDIF